MQERLFGMETEYAFTALGRQGDTSDRTTAVSSLLELARKTLPHLPGLQSGGIFLANGARFYVDCGLHPEMTTPECANPWDIVRYLLAGETLLSGLADAMRAGDSALGDVMFFKCNVDYGGAGTTWGAHESYLHSGNPEAFPAQIIPHLVSRVVYTGAGGFNPLSSGVEFTLSPRVFHLTTESSDQSTQNRAIFHQKDESLSSAGYHRLHLLCGESLCSEKATWLKVGATALVVAMIENGICPGNGVALRENPLTALRRFAADPTCTAETPRFGGQRFTAIGIQRRYLEQAETHLHKPWMPPWAEAVCREWRSMLDLLAGAPTSVERTCDWAIKRALFLDQLRRRGTNVDAVETWTRIVSGLNEALQKTEHRGPTTVDFILSKQSPISGEVGRLGSCLREKGLTWDGLSPFLILRRELFEIDTRFGQLGEKGIFGELDRAGVFLAHHVPGVDNIEHAMTTPPAVGRAGDRGRCVKRFTGNGGRYACDWMGVWDFRDKRMLDLTAPFPVAEKWQDMPRNVPEQSEAAQRAGLREILMGLRRNGTP